ncbi:hypothetical protein C0J52_24541 [Blattella germanica]|nr:hypothetical protein C0J52_24541 [Blattella germanica]
MIYRKGIRMLQSRHGNSDVIIRNRRMMTLSLDLLYNIIFRNSSNATISRPCKHGDSCLKLITCLFHRNRKLMTL